MEYPMLYTCVLQIYMCSSVASSPWSKPLQSTLLVILSLTIPSCVGMTSPDCETLRQSFSISLGISCVKQWMKTIWSLGNNIGGPDSEKGKALSYKMQLLINQPVPQDPLKMNSKKQATCHAYLYIYVNVLNTMGQRSIGYTLRCRSLRRPEVA